MSFLICGILICVIATIFKGFGPWYVYVIGTLGFAVILGPLVGFALYWSGKWTDKQRERNRQEVLDSDFFAALLSMGFEIKDDAAIGVLRGYTIIVTYEWKSAIGDCIQIKALFEPIFPGKPRTAKEHEKFYNTQIYNTKKNTTWIRQTLFWGECFLLCEVKLAFKVPKYEKFDKKINLMIDILQNGGLKPVDLVFYENIFKIHLYD